MANTNKKTTKWPPFPSLEPRENKIGNPNFVCSDSFLECFGYSNKSLENSGIMMMIARCPKTEGSGGKSLLKIGEADKVDFYRIQTVLLHLGRSYAMN